MNGFYQELRRSWYRALRRRSQRRLTWPRFRQLFGGRNTIEPRAAEV